MAGVSIKPNTPVDVIKGLLPFVDMVLVMTVEPGFSGQKFMPEAARKVKEIKDLVGYLGLSELIIQVDGGINAETAKICAEYGANCFVAGNYVYKNPDVKSAIQSLLEV